MTLKPSIGMIQALDDPAIFGSALKLSERQREPRQAIDDGARFLQLAWGRRSAKTLLEALIGLWHALPREEFSAYVRSDELRRVLAIACNEKQAREIVMAAESGDRQVERDALRWSRAAPTLSSDSRTA